MAPVYEVEGLVGLTARGGSSPLERMGGVTEVPYSNPPPIVKAAVARRDHEGVPLLSAPSGAGDE